MYRGKGGESIRFAACKLIEALSLAKIPFVNKRVEAGDDQKKPKITRTFGQLIQMNIDENLRHPNEEVQLAANKALRVFTKHCYSHPPKKPAFDLVSKYVNYVLKEENPSARRGFTLALGSFPESFYSYIYEDQSTLLDSVLDALKFSSEIEDDPEQRDPETRRNAATSLSSLCFTTQHEFFKSHRIEKAFEIFLRGSRDYSTENRGDVGSWVRQASLIALEDFMSLLIQGKHTSLFFLLILAFSNQTENQANEKISHEFLKTVIEACFEKIDKLRVCAGNILERVVHSSRFMFIHLPGKEQLERLCSSEIDWAKPHESYAKLLEYLYPVSFYRRHVFSGIIPSVGGIASSISVDYPHPLLTFMKTKLKTKEETEQFEEEVLAIFHTYQHNDRVILPLIKILSQLFRQNILNASLLSSHFGSELLSCLKKETAGCKEILKMLTSISLFCWLVTFLQPIRNSAFTRILVFLGNPVPKVRKLAANEIYTRLLIDDTILSPNQNGVMDLLSQTKWDAKDLQAIRGKRNEIAVLLGVKLIVK